MLVLNRPASNPLGLASVTEEAIAPRRRAAAPIGPALRDRQNRHAGKAPGCKKENASDETHADMATPSNKVANFGSLASSSPSSTALRPDLAIGLPFRFEAGLPAQRMRRDNDRL